MSIDSIKLLTNTFSNISYAFEIVLYFNKAVADAYAAFANYDFV